MDYKKYNDYELVYMVRENDDESKNILFIKYKPILGRLAQDYYRRYASYGYDYDDFFQEAVISFYHALAVYDEKKDSLFYSFLVLCVQRGLMTFCRNISCGQKHISSDYFVDYEEYAVEDKESNLSMIFTKREIEDIILDVIFNYPLEVSSIMELRINGFTYREIGTLLDIPPSSVEFRSRKARKELMSRIQVYYCK